MGYNKECTDQTDLASSRIVGKSKDMGEKIVVEWGKNLGKRKVGLEKSLVEDGVAGKKRKVVVFVPEGGGKVDGGRWRREGGQPFLLNCRVEEAISLKEERTALPKR